MSSGPVAGRGQQSPWLRPLAWLWAKKAWISAAVGALLIATTLYVLWAIKDLPDPSQNVLAAGDVMVLDRNGKLIEDWSPAGHYHVTLQLKEMGPYAPKAVLAAEDRNFYNHGAIDPMSTARAAWVDITSGGLHQGGSTITQQLVKIQLLTPQKSVTRKVQEIVLAIVDAQRPVTDILACLVAEAATEIHLRSIGVRQIPLGGDAFGVAHGDVVEAAAPGQRTEAARGTVLVDERLLCRVDDQGRA